MKVDKIKAQEYFKVINKESEETDENSVEYFILNKYNILNDYCNYMVEAKLIEEKAMEEIKKKPSFNINSPLDIFNDYADLVEDGKATNLLFNFKEFNDFIIDDIDDIEDILYNERCIYKVTADFLASDMCKENVEDILKNVYNKQQHK